MIGTYDELMARIQDHEPFRHACEVRAVAAMDTHAQRSVYIEGDKGVRERRGDAIADRLRRDVWECMKRQEREVEPLQEALAL